MIDWIIDHAYLGTFGFVVAGIALCLGGILFQGTTNDTNE